MKQALSHILAFANKAYDVLAGKRVATLTAVPPPARKRSRSVFGADAPRGCDPGGIHAKLMYGRRR